MSNKRMLKKTVMTLAIVSAAALPALAATDITGVVNDVSGYWEAAQTVAIGILLFVIGRRVVRKL